MNKKVMLMTAISAAMLSAAAFSASANTGIINFTGAISSSTCDFNVAVDGVVTPTGIVDMGTYKASDAPGTPDVFGTAKNISLVPDPATCDVPVAANTDATVAIIANQTDATNTDVLTTADSLVTNAGIRFTLASGDSVINKGGVALTAGSADLDANGNVNFVAQPYALSGTLSAGVIGGAVSYTVAYL
ncbi:hypothetical protein D6C13_24515 [Rahnella woolbedingensis]|uniref:Type 1 fimbrial protein n=2 Tax=Rahnella woolbedingensis TaxID=1510574 RepID=A0A419N252_9GAMM|nr:hypothetical protein D6C13_24515 [Rahnella woolbedingensis]